MGERVSDDGRIRPFSCGSQYCDWTDANCGGCSKAADCDNPPARCPCDIEQALLEACFGDGTVSADIGGRMGLAVHQGRYNWPCPERNPPFVERGQEQREAV